MKRTFFTVIFFITLLMEAQKVYAQSIDYSTMEELFGEPVTTSATGKPQRMSEAPVTMEIVTQEDIRRSGAVNIAEALRQVNGVNVLQRNDLQYDVSIRGYNKIFSTRLLVLVNGRAVYLDHFGIVDWSSIPVQMEEIRQIEVVKGPNTALFGFNAVSGVINIITYNPLYDNKSSAGITWGTQDYYRGNFVHTFKPNDRLGVRISAGTSSANSANNKANPALPGIRFADGVRVDNHPETHSMNVDAMFQVTEKAQLRAEVAAGYSQRGTVVSGGSYFREQYQTRAAKLSYDADTDMGLIKASVYKNILTNHPISSRNPSTATPGLMENEVLVAQLEDTLELNARHTVRLSGEYRDNELTSDNGSFLPAGSKVSYKVYSLSGMWNWKLHDQWDLTNAVRIDNLHLHRTGGFDGSTVFNNQDYDRELNGFSYNSGLVFKPTEEDTLRLMAARGLEIPTLLEFGFKLATPGGDILGSPYVDPTVVTNYELAWDHRLDSIEGFVRSSIFYQFNEDLKIYRAAPSGTPPAGVLTITNNVGDSQSVGMEIGVDGKFKEHFDWGLTYIFQLVDDDLNNGKTETRVITPIEFEEGDPKHQANLKLGYHEDEWEADTLFYYVSESRQFGAGGVFDDIDDYIGINARLAYSFDEGTILALHGQQLQQKQLETNISPDIDPRIFFSVTKKF